MSATPESLESYLSGRWVRGEGVETKLVDPVKGDELATVSAKGVDLKGALDYARRQGQGGLRDLGYAERAKLVGAVADVLVANRARYEAIAIANSGNTKTDAAIDIDGGIGTLKYYARLGQSLGEARMLLDEKPVRLAKAENYQAIHLMVPRRGVAIHINAFNFPSWGLWEKAAVSLLAGVPVLAKPASSTALLAHAMVKDVIAAKVLPDGALSLLCGGAGDLLDALTSDDVIAFTGSADTAARVRGHANVVARSVPVNIEADSINAALLAPDAAARRRRLRCLRTRSGARDDGEGRAEMHRDPPHLRAGRQGRRGRRGAGGQAQEHQGRRPAPGRYPHGSAGDARPAGGGVRRHPAARRRSRGRVRRRGAARSRRHRQEQVRLRGADPAQGQGSRLGAGGARGRGVRAGRDHRALSRRAGRLRADRAGRRLAGRLDLRRGQGSARPHRRARSAPGHGRILVVDPTIAGAHTGHGIVMPQCNHGGPGRAGAGEELGGLHGLRFYHQRLAVQGSSDLLAGLQAKAANLH